MKKIIIFIFVFLIGLISVNATLYNFTNTYMGYCYQETANSSIQMDNVDSGINISNGNCGLNYNGNYNFNSSDDNNNNWQNNTIIGSEILTNGIYNMGGSDFTRANTIVNGLNKSADLYVTYKLTNTTNINLSYWNIYALISSVKTVINISLNNCDINNNSIILHIKTRNKIIVNSEQFFKYYCNINNTETIIRSDTNIYNYIGDESISQYANTTFNKSINYSFSSSNNVYGETSNIILNLSKGSNQSYTNADLIYNGVTYSSPTQTEYSDYTLFTQSVSNTAIGNFTYYWNVSLTDYGNQFNFTTENNTHLVQGLNLNITYYNETNGVSLNGISVTSLLNNGLTQYTNTSTTGKGNFANLSSNNYTITISATGYETKYYQKVITSTSTYTLDAYLLPTTTNEAVFTIKDSDTGQSLENVNVKISRWVNNTLTNVEQLLTDVTGKITQNYETGIRYDYNLTLSGYTDKVFTLNPIQSATYTVLMDKSVSYTSDVDYSNIQIYWSPKKFQENTNPDISFTFNDATNTLEYYGFNATFQGNNLYMIGTQNDGETLTDNLTIGDSGIMDYVNINYFYKKTSGNRHDFNVRYVVYNASTLTWANNYNTSWGMGTFERTLIAVIIILVLAGSGAMFVGGVGAGVLAIAGIGLCVKIGLMSEYLAYPSMIILVLIVGWRASI